MKIENYVCKVPGIDGPQYVIISSSINISIHVLIVLCHVSVVMFFLEL